MPPSLLQKAAGMLAGSFVFRRGENLFARSSKDWNLPLSKFEKLCAGSWLILHDYSKGGFPPTFPDQQKAYQAERDYHVSIPGISPAQVSHDNMTKPFWFGASGRLYFSHFNQLTAGLEKTGINPPARVLELGCGGGWMSEFLAAAGFNTCGTTISEVDIADAHRRIKSLDAKGLSPALRFVAAPMEGVHEALPGELFDAVFVFEALHHAFDWRAAIRSSHACLRPGGWLLICNEPNVIHTCVSYRVAKLSNTHEIGFSKGELKKELRNAGFRKIVDAGAKFHFWFRPHWLFAQK